MQLKITIPYIRCEKPTFGFGADEVYFAVMVTAGKKVGNSCVPSTDKRLYFKVSEVQGAVNSGTQWVPALNDIVVDIGDANAFAVSVALYECDDSQIHDQMQKEATGWITPPGIDWGKITVPTNPADPLAWLLPALTFLWAAFNYFKQDDLVGHDMICAAVDDTNLSGPRDKEIKGWGGKYHFLIDLSVA